MKEPDMAAKRSGVSLTNCDGESSVGLADQQTLVIYRSDTDSGPKQQAPSVVQWGKGIARISEAINLSAIDGVVESGCLAPIARRTGKPTRSYTRIHSHIGKERNLSSVVQRRSFK